MKKLLCIALSVILAAGMAVFSSASVTTSTGVVTTGIKGINESVKIGNLVGTAVLNDKTTLSLDDLSDLEIGPGDVIKIPLPGSLFVDANGKAFTQGNVSLSALNSARVGVRASFSKGTGAYTVSLDGNRNGSHIKIEYANGIFLKPQEFTSSIYLSYNGSRKVSTRIIAAGVMQTATKELNWGDDYVDISDGSLIYTKSAIRNAEIYLGSYCTITRNLAKGVTYAGTATTDDINEQDIVVINRHPDIDLIYKLKTVGLKTTGKIVTFDLDRRYYVYNTNGNYIGMSNEALPYWTKYYLSERKYTTLNVK